MRFNKLDLNLLVALDALLKEQSITRAAESLNLSQSALSNSLAKLRDYFDDDLLIQIGRKMEVTPRAASLQDAVRDVLLRIDSTIAIQPDFVPQATDRSFRIFASDYFQMVLGPHLLEIAAREGCTATFEFLPLIGNPYRDLERGEADLLVIPSGFLSQEHPNEHLYNDDFMCVLWANSALAQGDFTFERYSKAGHVVMRPLNSQAEAFEAWFVKRYGMSRRDTVFTYGFSMMPALVVGTELVATVHGRLARLLAKTWPVVLRPCPIPIDSLEQCIQWHKYRTQDPGLIWLRKLMRQAVASMIQDN